jgi:hypothetical protein
MGISAAAVRAEDLQTDEALADKTLSQAQADAAVGTLEDRMSLGASASEPPLVNAEGSLEQVQASDWLWGEVVSVDTGANALTVKHLDYETADWVTKEVSVDDKTVFQGVSALADITAGANVTIEYTEKDGRFVADVIEVAPKETEPASPAPQEQGLDLNESTETAAPQEQGLDLNESTETAGDSLEQTGVNL